ISSVVLAVLPCPACGGSCCFEIRVVLISSLFGIHIFPWYHKRSSFHWHSPSATPFISFSFVSKFFLIARISLSFLLASCILPSSLSWNSASSIVLGVARMITFYTGLGLIMVYS